MSKLTNMGLTLAVIVGVVAIAGLSFALSYQVLANDAREAGVYLPRLFPIVVDAGIVVFISVRLYATLNKIRQGETWAQASIVVATLVSVALNVAHAVNADDWQYGVNGFINITYFVIPPIALATCAELLSMIIRHMAESPKLTDSQQLSVSWITNEVDDSQFAETIGVKPSTVRNWKRKMEL